MNVAEQIAVYERERAARRTEYPDEKEGIADELAGKAASASPRQIRRVIKLRRLFPDYYEHCVGLDVEGTLKFFRSQGIDPETDDIMPFAEGSSLALYHRLKLLGKIANRNALSVNYSALALTPQHARAASPFGAMRCTLDLGLDREVCVDATAFLGALRYNAEAAFTATVEDGALHWQCAAAKGRLPLVNATVAEPQFDGAMAELSGDFGPGLELAALGCGHSAFLRNAGLEIVQLHNRDGKAYAVTTDSSMIAACCLGERPLPADRLVTLKPEAATLLAEVTQQHPAMWFGIDDYSVYCVGAGIELQLFQMRNPGNRDLAAKLPQYLQHEVTMPLWRDIVAAFLKRVDTHTESKREAMVTILVEHGRTVLRFAETAGDTEEHYEVTDAPKISVPPIRIETRRLARALAHADELVFDYAAQNTLVLRGPNEFLFGIMGQRGG